MKRVWFFVLGLSVILSACGKEDEKKEAVPQTVSEASQEVSVEPSSEEATEQITEETTEEAIEADVTDIPDFRFSKWGDSLEQVKRADSELKNTKEADLVGNYIYGGDTSIESFDVEYDCVENRENPFEVVYMFNPYGELYYGSFNIQFTDNTEESIKAANDCFNRLIDYIYELRGGKESTQTVAIDENGRIRAADPEDKEIEQGKADLGAFFPDSFIVIHLELRQDKPLISVEFDGGESDEWKKEHGMTVSSNASATTKEEDGSGEQTSLIREMTTVADGCDTRSAKIGDSVDDYRESEKAFKLSDELKTNDLTPDYPCLNGSLSVAGNNLYVYAYFDKEEKLVGLYYSTTLGSRTEADDVYEQLKKVMDEKYGKPTKESDKGYQVTTKYKNGNGIPISLELAELDEEHEYINLRFGKDSF